MTKKTSKSSEVFLMLGAQRASCRLIATVEAADGAFWLTLRVVDLLPEMATAPITDRDFPSAPAAGTHLAAELGALKTLYRGATFSEPEIAIDSDLGHEVGTYRIETPEGWHLNYVAEQGYPREDAAIPVNTWLAHTEPGVVLFEERHASSATAEAAARVYLKKFSKFFRSLRPRGA